MLSINDTDSFGVELGKIFVQSILGAAVATAGIGVFVAGAGAALDYRNKRRQIKNPTIPTTETL